MENGFVNGQGLSVFFSKIKEWVEKRIDEKIDERMKGYNPPKQQQRQDDITCWERWWGEGGVR